MRQNLAFLAFNRGLVSRLGLARADIKRIALAAETFCNWMVRVLGSMMVRPGLGYLGSTHTNAAARFLPFVFSVSDKALVELTTLILRVWVNDALITRVAVASAVSNGTFPVNFNNWTDDDEGGTVSAWISAGLVGFTGNGTAYARRTQTVVVAAADQNVEHALRIVVPRGPLILRVGSTVGGDEYVNETTLETGTHSLAFTPTGNFTIRFLSNLERIVHLSECTVEAAGVMTLPTPWSAANLGLVRVDQSGDILFAACGKTTDTIGYQQRKIERRATRSWSVVLYQPEDGPFSNANITPTTLTASATTGNGTLTASTAIFKSPPVGALFALTIEGQDVSKNAAALNDATASILINGEVGTNRAFSVFLTGMTAGRTVVLEYSFDDTTWTPVASGGSWTADVGVGFDDGLDNQIIYYRLRLSVVGAAGATVMRLLYGLGGSRGIVRATGFTSSTVLDMEVLSPLARSGTATDDWEEGKWSDRRGWPSAVVFNEGRLWWFGKDNVAGSESDDFYGFDQTVEGDSGPIIRTIGSGPVDRINWALALQRLLLGGEGAEYSCRSTSFDEPLTPTNFNIKKPSTQGSAQVAAVQVDDNGLYVQRGGTRVYQLTLSENGYDYTSVHMTAIVPELCDPGIVRMAVQRQPDTRVHFVRSDGTAVVLIFDKTENVTCFLTVESDGAGGLIEDVVVLPGDSGQPEDQVYYVVKRTIGGATVRYLERWAIEDDCKGDEALCKLADSYVTYSGAPATVITGLSHMEGEEVVVWADSADVGHDADDGLIYTVAGGQIVLATAASNVVVGLPYTAQWKSGKLLQLQSQLGLMLTQEKSIRGLGMIMADVHRKGVKFGPDFDHLDDLPSVEDGERVAANAIRTDYDKPPFVFPGKWSPDSRVCLQGMAPRPATVLCLVAEVEA